MDILIAFLVVLGVALVLGIALAVVYDRKVVQRKKTVYTITGYPEGTLLESLKKGDNNLD